MISIKLVEMNDPLDHQGAVRHPVGSKVHKFQLKKSQTCCVLGAKGFCLITHRVCPGISLVSKYPDLPF